MKSEIEAYRNSRNLSTGFVVVSPHKVISGWLDELRSPDHFIAGSVATDIYGKQWLAVGGDLENGAEKWERI